MQNLAVSKSSQNPNTANLTRQLLIIWVIAYTFTLIICAMDCGMARPHGISVTDTIKEFTELALGIRDVQHYATARVAFGNPWRKTIVAISFVGKLFRRA